MRETFCVYERHLLYVLFSPYIMILGVLLYDRRITGLVAVLHPFFLWCFVQKLDWGIEGVACGVVTSQWVTLVLSLAYIHTVRDWNQVGSRAE